MADKSQNRPVYQKRLGRRVPRDAHGVGEPASQVDLAPISEEQLHVLIENHHAVMLLVDPDSGTIVDANRAASRFYGFSPRKLCGKKIADISQLPPAQIAAELQRAAVEGIDCFISRHKLANDELRIVEIHASPIAARERRLLFCIVHDITEHKQCEEELKTNVKNLEELNTALKVILQQIEESREELHAAIVSNMGELILPGLDKLKKSPLSAHQYSILQSIEANLLNISSSFLKKLKMIHHKLTSREMEIASLVKEGKSTKEIAEQMDISTKTVEFHRNRLREKLGLTNKKTNLRSHLLTIK